HEGGGRGRGRADDPLQPLGSWPLRHGRLRQPLRRQAGRPRARRRGDRAGPEGDRGPTHPGLGHRGTRTGRDAVLEAPVAASVTTTKSRPCPGGSVARVPVPVPPEKRSFADTCFRPISSRARAVHVPHPVTFTVTLTWPPATVAESDAIVSAG